MTGNSKRVFGTLYAHAFAPHRSLWRDSGFALDVQCDQTEEKTQKNFPFV